MGLGQFPWWAGVVVCWAVLLGTGLQLQQPALWSADAYGWLGFGGLICLLAALRWVKTHPWAWAVLCGALTVLTFASTGWRACERWEQRLPAELEGPRWWVQGEVVGLPQVHPDGIRFLLSVSELQDAQGQPHVLTHPLGLIWLGWYGQTLPDLQAGERWRLPVKLKAPHGHVNPFGFDLERWFWEQSIVATGYVRDQATNLTPQRLAPSDRLSLHAWRQAVRSSIFQTVSHPATAGVLAALLVGDQSSIERADWEVFRATGVAHLMAISGLHITGLAWLAGWFVALCWQRLDRPWWGRPPSLWLAAPYVMRWTSMVTGIGYAAFSGLGIPAQRTVWMLSIVHLLAMRGWRWPRVLTLSFVAAIVVCLDPWALLQAGFALSFAAVSVLMISTTQGAQTTQEHNGRGRMAQAWRALVREQVLMTVCLAPLSLLLFQQISLVGLIANLFAVPWITLVVTPLCLAGLCVAKCWIVAAWCLEAFMPLLHELRAFPVAQWSAAAAPWWISAVALLGACCIAVPWPWWMRFSGLCWCVPLLTWKASQPVVGTFELWAADMGQGHAVLLRTSHHALLYDTGPRYSSETDAGQRVVVPLLRALDVKLDRVMLSHQDIDHSGGLHAVMAMQPQADVWTSVAMDHPMLAGLQAQPCRRGQQWQWDGVRFEVLHPPAGLESGREVDRDHSAQSRSKPNASSCVLRVQDAKGVRALLVGDIEAAQEQQLVQSKETLAADWLLVPHHGSNTSSTLAFLQAVQPRWAVVQAGYRNRYGHPREEVLARYVQAHIPVVQTVSCGAAMWRSSAPQEMQCERQIHPHYWQHQLPASR